MEIILYRHPGYLGRAVPLDVFVNGERVAAIQSGTSLKIFGGVSKSMLTLNEAIIDVKKG